MAYVKTGRVREVRRGTKAAVAIALVAVLLILAGVVFWVANPRAARQLVLSDQDYASYVLLKNGKTASDTYAPYLERLRGESAYDTTAKMVFEPSADTEDLVGSEEAMDAAQRYLDNVTFTSNTQVHALHFSNELQLKDSRQTILTHRLAYVDSGVFTSVDEYGYGWTRLFTKKVEPVSDEQRIATAILTSGDETVQDAVKSAAKKGYKSIKKDVQVTIDDDVRFDFQDKHVTDQRVNILLTKQEAQTFLETFFDELSGEKGLTEAANRALDSDDQFESEEAFRAYLTDLKQYYNDTMDETGVSRMSVDLCVNKQNEILAFDALVKRSEGDVIVNAMLRDDEGRGPSFQLRSGGENVLKFEVEKSSKQSGHVDFALGSFENTVTYNELQLADGFVYGNFEFAPSKVSWSDNLGTFGLHLTIAPAATAEASGFQILAQTGFSTLGTVNIEANVVEAKYTGMLTDDDIVVHSEYKTKEKRARRLQYWLSDLPEQDSQYKNALRQIVQTLLTEAEDEASAAKTAESTANETLGAGATRSTT